jgi:DNA-binding SARP family transcriptional activator
MFFRILGRLEVSVNGKDIALGKNRQQTVLSLLLADLRRSVSVSRIIETIWNGAPPRTAAEQVQTCIWRLRRSFALADAPPDLIETTPTGYALRVDPEQVDAYQFEWQAAQARRSAERGDLSLAASQLRAALSLFRGPVLEEVAVHSSPAVEAIAEMWEERRLAALEECIGYELDCGRSREVVDELSRLVALHPLRERLRAHLMLALFQGDRRAEALAVYRQGRAELVEQLGLEPGRTLQDLHSLILSDEASAPVPPGPASSRPRLRFPAQLVADLPDYVARPECEQPVREALTAARGAVRICGVHGPWGVGKTALAVHMAHRLRAEFPDGQIFADLRGSRRNPAEPAEVLAAFLQSLGVPGHRIPARLPERSALYRSLLDGRRALVVLDDVGSAETVQPLLPGGPESALLITSRTQLADLPGNVPVRVDVLAPGQASELFRKVAGAQQSEVSAVAIASVARAVGGHPLAVRAVAARSAARPHLDIWQLAARLSDSASLLDELSYGVLDLREYLAPAMEALTLDARRLWCAMGLLQLPEFAAWTASAALQLPASRAEAALDHLVDSGLMEVAGLDELGIVRYRMHRLAGLYARECAARELTAVEYRRASDRVANCRLRLSERARRLLQGAAPDALPPSARPADVCRDVLARIEAAPASWLRLEADGPRLSRRHAGPAAVPRPGGPHDRERGETTRVSTQETVREAAQETARESARSSPRDSAPESAPDSAATEFAALRSVS